MARARTTLDSFNAVAEPRRRQMLGVLAEGELAVNDIVDSLGWHQPQVSKHLRVLLQVGLVRVRRDGRQRLYSVEAAPLKPIHDWAATFEHLWQHQLDRVKQRAEAKAALARDRGSVLPGGPGKT
ncbi:MAG: winged helix-turn-helix transcriptional regulator [Phycisphaerae bacterium]|nr:winged helix-turn-helix transcriptional regulator [Phycisphaerae bacterium]